MDARSAIRPRRGPKLPDLALTDQERTTLERWARRRTSSQALAERCRIVLACASGASNTEVAQRLGVARSTAHPRPPWSCAWMRRPGPGVGPDRAGAAAPGRVAERRTHDDRRHGMTNLYAALDLAVAGSSPS
jgi:hypothetical protein